MDEKCLGGDPKLVWQDQIAGVIDYDYGDFIGALADLEVDPDWKAAFAGIAVEPGVPAFLDRLQRHFDLCRSPLNEDGSVYPFQHPSRTVREKHGADGKVATALMRRYLGTVADVAAERSEEDAERWRRIDVVWTDDPSAVDDDPYARDGDPAGVSLYEEMGDIDTGVIDGAPEIQDELREACYGLASDYELQRYLMRSFHTHPHDVDPIYELNWVHGCDVWFDETTCHVYDRVAHAAWKRARASEAAD